MEKNPQNKPHLVTFDLPLKYTETAPGKFRICPFTSVKTIITFVSCIKEDVLYLRSQQTEQTLPLLPC